MTHVQIIGGHGQVALLLAKLLSKHAIVESFIRSESQSKDITATGAKPTVFDVTQASVAELKTKLNADIVVWMAGNGGKGGKSETFRIDRDGPIRVIDALKTSPTIKRFIMVSAIGAEFTSKLTPSFFLYDYYHAKFAADEYIRANNVPYTILGPGWLSNEPGTGLINAKLDDSVRDPQNPNPPQVSRSDVAKVASTIILNKAVFDAQLNKTIDFVNGSTPIEEALMS